MPVFFKPVSQASVAPPSVKSLKRASVASSVNSETAAASSVAPPAAAAAAAPPPPTAPPPDAPIGVLDLPVEILSHILSYLPLATLVQLALDVPFVHSLCASPILQPWSPAVADALASPEVYPSTLAQLGTYPFVPPKVIVEILVRARPDWVLFEFEVPVGLGEDVWQDICRRRFLPGWLGKEWKRNLSWRALYLRTLNRISHRARTSCAIDEPFSRFIVLERRGTATINRLRTATFNPFEAYDSITSSSHQAPPQSTVRPVLRLTDCTVYAMGVLDRPTSVFVNHNAFDFLHPPLVLREVRAAEGEQARDISAAAGLETKEGKGKGKMRERAFSEGGAGLLDRDGDSGRVGRSIAWNTPTASSASSRPPPPSHAATYTNGNSGGAGTGGQDRRSRVLIDRDDSPSPSSSGQTRRAFSIPLSRTLSGGKSSASGSGGGSSSWRESSSFLSSASSSLGSMFRPRASREPSFSADAGGTGGKNVWIASAAPPPLLLDLSPVPSAASSPRSGALRLPARDRSADSSGRNTPNRPSTPRLGPGMAGASPAAHVLSAAALSPPTATSLTFAPEPPEVRVNRAIMPTSVPPLASLSPEVPRAPARPQRQPILRAPATPYRPLARPSPAEAHRLYPNHTPGGADLRMRPSGRIWSDEQVEGGEKGKEGEGEWEGREWEEMEGSKVWVGPLMIFAVLNPPSSTTPPSLPSPHTDPFLHSLLPASTAYTSFDTQDLWALAPWLLRPGAGDGASGRGVKGGRVWGGIGFLREEGRGIEY